MEDGTLLSPGHIEGTDTPRRVETTQACAIRDLLDRLGDKWSLLVVELLGEGTRRFTELRRWDPDAGTVRTIATAASP